MRSTLPLETRCFNWAIIALIGAFLGFGESNVPAPLLRRAGETRVSDFQSTIEVLRYRRAEYELSAKEIAKLPATMTDLAAPPAPTVFGREV